MALKGAAGQAARAAALEAKRSAKAGTTVDTPKSVVDTPVASASPDITGATQHASASPDITQAPAAKPSILTDALKGSDTYKNLISKGFTPEQIESKLSDVQAVAEQRKPTAPVVAAEPAGEDRGQTDMQKARAMQLESQRESGTTPKEVGAKVEDVKIGDIVPKFGYETTIAERQGRNQQIAEGLFNQNKTFNEAKILDEIKQLAPDVTEGEIMNTVNDIRDRFSRLKMLDEIATIDSNTIATNITNGDISMSDIDGLKITDPAKWAEISNMVSQNNKISEYNSTMDSMGAMFGDDRIETAFGYLDSINANYSAALQATDGEEALKTYQDALNDEDLVAKKEELTVKEGEVKQLDLQLNDLRRSVEEEFKGASDSLINSVVADRGADLIRQKNSLMVESQTLATSVNNSITQAQQNYDLNLKQEMMERENVITQYGMDMNSFNMKYEAMQKNLDKEEKLEFAKLGMLEQLDLANISESDIEGLDAAGFVKDMLKFKKTIESNADTKYNMQVVDGNMVFYDDYGNVKDTYNPSDMQSNIRWSSSTEMRTDRHNNPTALMWTKGVSDFFKSRGYDVSKGDKFPNSDNYTIDMTNVSDPVQATIDYIDAYGFDYKGTPRRTHTSMSDDEWNSKSYEDKRDVVKKMYANEGGSGSIFGESVTSQSNDYRPEMASYYIKFNQPTGSKLTTADLNAIKDTGIGTEEFMKQAYNYKKAEDMKMKPQAERLMNDIMALQEDLVNLDNVDYNLFRGNVPLTDGRQLHKNFKQILSSQALQNLIALKEQGATFGALSDNELAFITDMATNLDIWAKRDDFEAALEKSRRILVKGMANIGGTSSSTSNPFDEDEFFS